MSNDVAKWETMEFDDVKDYGDLYQNLSLFKYGNYSKDIKEVMRKRRIYREANGHLVVIEFNNRQVSYFFKLNDGSVTKPIASRKLPYFKIPRETQNELVLLLAEAETNAHFNFPSKVENFEPLDLPKITFSKN